MKKIALVILVCCLPFLARAESCTGIPVKQDPPIMIDGELGDWKDVPLAFKFDNAAQISGNKRPDIVWKGTNDLSGTAKICWDNFGIFVIAVVKDDSLEQKHAGGQLWLGDHVELYLDMIPGIDNGGTGLGKGQFQFGISPGDFKSIKPEIYCFHPKNTELPGAHCEASRTTDGWMVEALIPWSVLGMDSAQIKEGKNINFEFFLSDTDANEPDTQKFVMTTRASPWNCLRAGLRPGILADANGKYKDAAPVGELEIFKLIKVKPDAPAELTFNISDIPDGTIPVLSLKARLCSQKYAGYTSSMMLEVNGKKVKAERLINKPLRIPEKNGAICNMCVNDMFVVPYAPDFETGNKRELFRIPFDFHGFEFDLNGLLGKGKNVIKISEWNKVPAELELKDGKLQIKLPFKKTEKKKAPTGEHSLIEPGTNPVPAFNVTESANPIKLNFNNRTWEVKSQYSTPDGKWVTASNAFFKHTREIKKLTEGIEVVDKFENLTKEPLPLMQRHEARINGNNLLFYMNGLEAIPGGGLTSSFNCTSYGGSEQGGIGLMPLNTEFRIHAENYISGKDSIGLCDDQTVIPGNGSITQRFVVIPTKKASYWDFLNPLRKILGANFKIDGSMSFFGQQNFYKNNWTTQEIEILLNRKNSKIVGFNIPCLTKDGKYWVTNNIPHWAFASLYFEADNSDIRKYSKIIRTIKPTPLLLAYFHSQNDNSETAEKVYQDARVIYKNGKQATYGGRTEWKIFFPTMTNEFGKMLSGNLKRIFDELEMDGIMWDEINHAGVQYHYGTPWDNCSGDIDKGTHKLITLKSSVCLLQLPWQEKVITEMKSQNKYIITNGYALGLEKFKMPGNTETAQISNCARMHIWTPIQLGHHSSDIKNTLDCYRQMLEGLDYACVYYWYGANVNVTHNTLTDHMFPLTPIELHKGYIIGEERIITKVSGLFGWGDNSEHEIKVYDEYGYEVKDHKMKSQEINGKTYSELRLAEDWSAVVIKKEIKK